MADLIKRYWSSVPWLGRLFTFIPVLLLLFPPLWGWELETVKIFFWSLAILGCLLWYLLRRLNGQKFVWPPRSLTIILLLWSIAILLSFWWSTPRSLSWWGAGLEADSAWFLLILVITVWLARAVINRRSATILWYGFWSLGSGLLILSQLLFWWQPSLAAMFNLPIGVGNLIGKWNDFGLLMGFNSLLFAVLAAFSLRLSRFRFGWFAAAMVMSLVSLGFTVLVNLLISWLIVGALAVLLLSVLLARRQDWHLATASFLPLIVVLLTAFIFLTSANEDSWLTGKLLPLQRTLRVTSVEVRPSFLATLTIARGVLSQDTWLGVGPAKFERAWWQFRPVAGINETRFWSSDFQAGFSWLLTIMVSLGGLGTLAVFSLLGGFLWLALCLLFGWGLAGRPPSPSELWLGVAGLYWLAVLFLYPPGAGLVVIAWLWGGVALGVRAQSFSESTILPNQPRLVGSRTLLNGLVILMSCFLLVGGLALGTRGWALWQLARAEELAAENNFLAAETALEKAISLGPLATAQRQLVENSLAQLEVLSREGEAEHIRARFKAVVDRALRAAQAATAFDGGDYRNWLVQGQVYEVLHNLQVTGSYEEAFAAYQTAAWLNPSNPQLWFELARLAASNKDWASAESQLIEALKRKSDFAPARLLLVQIQEAQGQVETARQALQAAVLATPNDFGLRFQLGYLQYRSADYQPALETLMAAWRLRPTSAEIHYFLALTYEALGDLDAARQWLEPLIRQEPDNPAIINLMNRLETTE